VAPRTAVISTLFTRHCVLQFNMVLYDTVYDLNLESVLDMADKTVACSIQQALVQLSQAKSRSMCGVNLDRRVSVVVPRAAAAPKQPTVITLNAIIDSNQPLNQFAGRFIVDLVGDTADLLKVQVRIGDLVLATAEPEHIVTENVTRYVFRGVYVPRFLLWKSQIAIVITPLASVSSGTSVSSVSSGPQPPPAPSSTTSATTASATTSTTSTTSITPQVPDTAPLTYSGRMFFTVFAATYDVLSLINERIVVGGQFRVIGGALQALHPAVVSAQTSASSVSAVPAAPSVAPAVAPAPGPPFHSKDGQLKSIVAMFPPVPLDKIRMPKSVGDAGDAGDAEVTTKAPL
jgi:hypothetical protein